LAVRFGRPGWVVSSLAYDEPDGFFPGKRDAKVIEKTVVQKAGGNVIKWLQDRAKDALFSFRTTPWLKVRYI
jgi:hypothetical protein